MNRTCVALRHVHAEDLGSFTQSVARHGYTIRYVEAWGASGADFEAAAEADLLVVLGGPIGVYESSVYPFLDSELALLRARLSRRAPTLGICLGAQLMAHALGCSVHPGKVKEVGWAPLKRDPELPASSPARALFQDDAEIMMLHWHGDTYELPAGATRLASTAEVREQGFSIGDHAMAWQCHPEFLPEALEAWLVMHAHELGSVGGAERIARIREDTARHGGLLVERGREMMDAWLKGLSSAPR